MHWQHLHLVPNPISSWSGLWLELVRARVGQAGVDSQPVRGLHSPRQLLPSVCILYWGWQLHSGPSAVSSQECWHPPFPWLQVTERKMNQCIKHWDFHTQGCVCARRTLIFIQQVSESLVHAGRWALGTGEMTPTQTLSLPMSTGSHNMECGNAEWQIWAKLYWRLRWEGGGCR